MEKGDAVGRGGAVIGMDAWLSSGEFRRLYKICFLMKDIKFQYHTSNSLMVKVIPFNRLSNS